MRERASYYIIHKIVCIVLIYYVDLCIIIYYPPSPWRAESSNISYYIKYMLWYLYLRERSGCRRHLFLRHLLLQETCVILCHTRSSRLANTGLCRHGPRQRRLDLARPPIMIRACARPPQSGAAAGPGAGRRWAPWAGAGTSPIWSAMVSMLAKFDGSERSSRITSGVKDQWRA